MADKQLEATAAASAFQKQWFADLRRRVFDERQPYALLQADVPFELFDLLDIPAVSNQWWAAIIAAKRQAPQYLDAMRADGLHGDLCRYCSLGFASTRYPSAGDAPWGGLPTPRLLCARLTCDCIQRVFAVVGRGVRRRTLRDRSPGRRRPAARAGGSSAGTSGASSSSRTGWRSSSPRSSGSSSGSRRSAAARSIATRCAIVSSW